MKKACEISVSSNLSPFCFCLFDSGFVGTFCKQSVEAISGTAKANSKEFHSRHKNKDV